MVLMGMSYGSLGGLHTVLSEKHSFDMGDPMVTKAKLTVRMATESLAAMEKVQQDDRVVDSDSWLCRLPVLLVQGSEDKITSVPLAQEFYKRLASCDKEFKQFEGLYHCIFNEPERDTVTEYICDWLTKRFACEERADAPEKNT